MKTYHRSFGKIVGNLAGGFGGSGVKGAAGKDEAFIANVAWAIALAVVIVITILLAIFLSGLARQALIATVWGVFLGLTFLFYFPQKLLITFIGGVVGSGLTKLADVIEGLRNFAGAAKDINEIINGVFGGNVAIQNGSVLIFMALTFLCCLPSYRGSE